MRIIVVAAFDSAAGVYGRPAFYASTGLAIRAFGDEVNRVSADNPMNVHPGDFMLFAVGSFDDVKGVFDSTDCPMRLATATELKL